MYKHILAYLHLKSLQGLKEVVAVARVSGKMKTGNTAKLPDWAENPVLLLWDCSFTAAVKEGGEINQEKLIKASH